jgi:hypothetical protein
MFIAPGTEIEVEQTIRGFKTNSAAGFDEIPMSYILTNVQHGVMVNKSNETANHLFIESV